jgi:hypothetical protein
MRQLVILVGIVFLYLSNVYATESMLYSIEESDISCQEAIYEQFDAFMIVVDRVAESCKDYNEKQEAEGFPGCGHLCLEKFLRKIESKSVDVTISVGANMPLPGTPSSGSSSSGGYTGSFSGMSGMGGMSGMSSMYSSNRNGINFKLEMKVHIPLGPTDNLECTNPMFSSIVKDFSKTILGSKWVVDKFEKACTD